MVCPNYGNKSFSRKGGRKLSSDSPWYVTGGGLNFFSRRTDSCLHSPMEESSQAASLFLAGINLTACLFLLWLRLGHKNDGVPRQSIISSPVQEAGLGSQEQFSEEENRRMLSDRLFVCLSHGRVRTQHG